MTAQPVDLGLSTGPETLSLVLGLAQQATVGLVLSLGHGIVTLGLSVTDSTRSLARNGMGGVLGISVQLLSLGFGIVSELVGLDLGVVSELVSLGSGLGGDLLGLCTDLGGAV